MAKEDGSWDWALVGPDPETLPITGGGSVGLEELHGAAVGHANSFGLLRLHFGTGSSARCKWVFLHVCVASMAVKERGQAMAIEPKMHKAIHAIRSFSARVQLLSQADCTVEWIVDQLQGALRHQVQDTDSEFISVTNYFTAAEERKLRNPELVEIAADRCENLEHIRNIEPPSPVVVEPEAALPCAKSLPDLSQKKQRKKIKLPRVGDLVEFFSLRNKAWMLDGKVVEAVSELCLRDGVQCLAGSLKVVFGGGSTFEWISPHQTVDRMRPSSRPRPPEHMCGELSKETHGWLAYWHTRYFELKDGFLQWWDTEQSACQGQEAKGSVYVLGMRLTRKNQTLRMQAECTHGTIYSFEAPSAMQAMAWANTLWEHAGYCEAVRDFKEGRAARSDAFKHNRFRTKETLGREAINGL